MIDNVSDFLLSRLLQALPALLELTLSQSWLLDPMLIKSTV